MQKISTRKIFLLSPMMYKHMHCFPSPSTYFFPLPFILWWCCSLQQKIHLSQESPMVDVLNRFPHLVRGAIQHREDVVPQTILPHAFRKFVPMTSQNLKKRSDSWIPHLEIAMRRSVRAAPTKQVNKNSHWKDICGLWRIPLVDRHLRVSELTKRLKTTISHDWLFEF